MEKNCKLKLGQSRKGSDLSWSEREELLEEYLSSDLTKQAIWKKYTGQAEEHGQILSWLRKLGYEDKHVNNRRKSGAQVSMEKKEEERFEHLQLKKRIRELEKELQEAKLKAIAWSTMLELAEQEYKIKIRKKYNTKPSNK